MTILVRFLLCILSAQPLLGIFYGQTSDSVRLPNNEGSCNVVNLHCGAAQAPSEHQAKDRLQGPPGKLGPIGSPGPNGLKGSKGEIGRMGDTGESINMTQIQLKIVEMLGAKSCKELMTEHGFTTPGIYLIRSGIRSVYVYCDFHIYEGASTCDDLSKLFNITQQRYFLTKQDQDSEIIEIFCPLTCQDIYNSGIRESGMYELTDANLAVTFRVNCNFVDGKGITEIYHDVMTEKTNQEKCASAGCYSWSPNYKISDTLIVGIIKKSRECRQFIKARCTGTAFVESSYAWWISRNGEKMKYWGGATSRRAGYCACGETNSCVPSGYKCNCDSQRATADVDEGYLTDKTKLPVREMRFGDLDDSGEKIWHTLGKLECWE